VERRHRRTAEQTDGRLVFELPANAQFESQFNTVGVNYGTKCRFPGNFDARVDFALLTWPPGNGASTSLTLYQRGPVMWIGRATWSQWGDYYNSWPQGSNAQVADTSGTLRLARSNGVVTTFFQHSGQWRKLGSQAVSGEIWLGLTLGTNADLWQHVDVSAAFDNFVVTAPDADCPAGSDPRGS
jgi:hypothetical protein